MLYITPDMRGSIQNMTALKKLALVAGIAAAAWLMPNDVDAQTARAEKLQQNRTDQNQPPVQEKGTHYFNVHSVSVQFNNRTGDVPNIVVAAAGNPDPKTGAVDLFSMRSSLSRDGAIDNYGNNNAMSFEQISYVNGNPAVSGDYTAYVRMRIAPHILSQNKAAFLLMRQQSAGVDAPITAGSYEVINEMVLEGFTTNFRITDENGNPSRNPLMDARSLEENNTYGLMIGSFDGEHVTRFGNSMLDIMHNLLQPAPRGVE